MKENAAMTAQARRFLLLLCSTFLVLILASLYFDLRGIDEQYKNLAAEEARSFYQAIDTMREWNLSHEGIYVRVTEDTLPSKYLNESLREASTTDGRRLAMINHAEMTRLISELLAHQRGIQLHITSLTPIRPDNKPDLWERHALDHFEQGSEEEFAVTGTGSERVFQYMAPLKTKPLCLSCHQGQDEKPRSVRGGISVAFSYEPFLKVMARERRQNILVHTLFFGLGLALIALTGSKLVRSIGALQDSLLHIKRLEGFLPICSQCKKIRLKGADQDQQEAWIAIERYIQERTDAEFTHGLCPQCAAELYPQLFKKKNR